MLGEDLEYLLSFIKVNDDVDFFPSVSQPTPSTPEEVHRIPISVHWMPCVVALVIELLCLNWVIHSIFLKSVVPFPSKGSTIIFYSTSCSSFLYLLSACNWASKQVRYRVRDWSSTKPTQRQWQSPEAAAPVSAPLLLRACATGFRHIGNSEKGHNYILT